MKPRLSKLLFTTVLMLGPGLAQDGSRAETAPGGGRREGRMGWRDGRGRGMRGVERLEELNKMSPEEREKALANLSPERRKLIEARLERLQSLSPQQRQRLLRRLENFRQLPPERQESARRLFREFRDLPPERRRAVRVEMQSVRTLSEADRRSRMTSSEFRSRFSPAEQQMIRELSPLIPASRQ
jgi:phage-related protein